jgi:hypothetical protein
VKRPWVLRWWLERGVAAVVGGVLGFGSCALFGTGWAAEVTAALVGAVAGVATILLALKQSAGRFLRNPIVAIRLPRRRVAVLMSFIWLVGFLAVRVFGSSFPGGPELQVALIGSHSAFCASVAIGAAALGQRLDAVEHAPPIGDKGLS